MLKNVNYAMFKCQECQSIIKVGAGELVDKVECDCTKKEVPKPKKKPAAKKEK